VRDDLIAGNARYAKTFVDSGLGAEPAKRLCVVTCMDTRLDVYALLGLQLGDAHVLRNAGGRVTDDVLRSLVVSIEVLGTRSVAVIQHTECGMTKVTNAELRDLLRERRGVDSGSIDFLPIEDHETDLREDVERLRSSPVLPPDLEVSGFLYDIRTGRLAPMEA
jgi:carbonic anhydrase